MSLRDSTKITPRPVWARWLRRKVEPGFFAFLAPPTEQERWDAIDVLAELVEGDNLAEEALRILTWRNK